LEKNTNPSNWGRFLKFQFWRDIFQKSMKI
jgi:hypothetical protein